MELFELSKVLFENPGEWDKISNYEKKKHYFMMNRFMSISFPLQAHVLSHIRINPVEVLNFWQRFIRTKYKKVPFWMYTKGAKKSREAKEKKINISNSLIEEYSKAYEIDLKSIRSSLKIFPKQTQKELKMFEKIMKQ